MMTSQVVRGLEERLLLTRCAHPTDARARSIATTPAGRELARAARMEARRATDEVFEVLGPEKIRLIELLRQVSCPRHH